MVYHLRCVGVLGSSPQANNPVTVLLAAMQPCEHDLHLFFRKILPLDSESLVVAYG